MNNKSRGQNPNHFLNISVCSFLFVGLFTRLSLLFGVFLWFCFVLLFGLVFKDVNHIHVIKKKKIQSFVTNHLNRVEILINYSN